MPCPRERGDPYLLGLRAQGDLEDQFFGFLVDQEQGGGAGGDHARRRLHDHLQQARVRDRSK